LTRGRAGRETRRAAWAAALVLGLALAPAVSPAREILSPVGGVLALTAHARERWGWSGAWRYPVGDARDYTAAAGAGEPGYRLLRSVLVAGDTAVIHQGADLGCGRGGGPVRAAAAGLVLVADRTGWNSGYGRYVVLGHRLPGGSLVYSVYAHLAEGSIAVRAGQLVAAGARLGRVGQTGRATTPHLHFEVRMATAGNERWEKEAIVDPLDFVAVRLATPVGPDTLGRYLEWAQYAGLIEGAADPGEALSRTDWWRMLAFASRQDLAVLPPDPGVLAESLVAAGVLSAEPRPTPGGAVDWNDIARDLDRIRDVGLRLPARPIYDSGHRATCETWLGTREPARAMHRPAALRPGRPTVATALLAVADLAPALEKPRPRPRRPKIKPPALAAGDSLRAGKPPAGKADSTRAARPAPAVKGRAAGAP